MKLKQKVVIFLMREVQVLQGHRGGGIHEPWWHMHPCAVPRSLPSGKAGHLGELSAWTDTGALT